MTTLSAHTTRAIHNKGMQAVYGIAAEYDVDVTDVIALLRTTSHTSVPEPKSPFVRLPDSNSFYLVPPPHILSQPVQSSSLAPAADTPAVPPASETEGEVVPPVAASPAVKAKPPHGLLSTAPKVSATHAAHPDWPARLIAQHLGITNAAARSAAAREGIVLPSWWEYQRAQAKAKTEALRTAVNPPQAAPVEPEPEPPSPAIHAAPIEPSPPAKRVTIADKIRAHLEAHPDATLAEVTEAIGGNMKAVGWAALKAGIVLRKRNAQERSEASARGRARLAETLTPPDETSIQPDETVMSAPQAVHQYRPAPLTTARFYLRDGAGRYLHQSLERSPTDTGPLMTTNRKWAWFDNSQRYRGALKLWPEISALRKEGAPKV